jgi:hypothetical protein
MNPSIAEAAETCRNLPINAYWNNATATPDQSVINAGSLSPFLAYIIAGAIASVFNIICILIFVTKKVRFSNPLVLMGAFGFINFGWGGKGNIGTIGGSSQILRSVIQRWVAN